MAVKVTFEFDNAEELKSFLAQFRVPVPKAPGKNRGVFRESDIEALLTLTELPDGLATRELAEKLGVATHRLPPIVNGWNRRARAKGLSLDDLLIREPTSRDGRPATIYRLTERGRELAREEAAGKKVDSGTRTSEAKGATGHRP